MRKYIGNIMGEIGFPDEAQDCFLKLYDGFTDSDFAFFEKLRKDYFLETADTNKDIMDKLFGFAAAKGINEYSLNMLFLLLCTEQLEKAYAGNGIPREVYICTLTDLRAKLYECKNLYSVWGTFDFCWFRRFFLCTRFGLGRFQYETNVFDVADYYSRGGISIKNGDLVHEIHIPSLGAMPKDMRMESYKKAFEFYGYKKGEKIIFACRSWLLYQDNEKFLDKNSNIYSFMQDFDIVRSRDYDNAFNDAWRVFYKDYTGSTDDLPKDTTLRRRICDWLDKGNKIGSGYGIIVFDGEKIINR